jgi:hypothetical protein
MAVPVRAAGPPQPDPRHVRRRACLRLRIPRPLADRVAGTDRLAWASTPCVLKRIPLKKVCGGASALSEESSSSSSSYSKHMREIEDDDEGRGRVRLPVGRLPYGFLLQGGGFSRI